MPTHEVIYARRRRGVSSGQACRPHSPARHRPSRQQAVLHGGAHGARFADAVTDAPGYFAADELWVDRAPGPVSQVHLAFQAQDCGAVERFFARPSPAGGKRQRARGRTNLPPRLLRRVRSRPRWQQHRSRLTTAGAQVRRIGGCLEPGAVGSVRPTRVVTSAISRVVSLPRCCQEVSDVGRLSIELERETDGRWIAEVVELPGVLAYA